MSDDVARIDGVGGSAASVALPAQVSAPSSTRTPVVVALVVTVIAQVFQLALIGTAWNVSYGYWSRSRGLLDVLGVHLQPMWGSFGDERARALGIQEQVLFTVFFALPLLPGLVAVLVGERRVSSRRDPRLRTAWRLTGTMAALACLAGWAICR